MVQGPQPLSKLLAPITRPALRSRSPAVASLMADWVDIVGPELARAASPRRLAAGTLTLACAGVVALELQHLEGALIGRINLRLGSNAVARLRFVHAEPGARVPGTRVPAGARPRSAPVAVAGVGAELAQALGRLGAAVADRGRSPTGGALDRGARASEEFGGRLMGPRR